MKGDSKGVFMIVAQPTRFLLYQFGAAYDLWCMFWPIATSTKWNTSTMQGGHAAAFQIDKRPRKMAISLGSPRLMGAPTEVSNRL